jgi:hypothetical protein
VTRRLRVLARSRRRSPLAHRRLTSGRRKPLIGGDATPRKRRAPPQRGSRAIDVQERSLIRTGANSFRPSASNGNVTGFVRTEVAAVASYGPRPLCGWGGTRGETCPRCAAREPGRFRSCPYCRRADAGHELAIPGRVLPVLGLLRETRIGRLAEVDLAHAERFGDHRVLGFGSHATSAMNCSASARVSNHSTTSPTMSLPGPGERTP